MLSGVNLAFNIRCSFSKSETKWLRNKDVGQQNAHCRVSFAALYRHKRGWVWPFTPRQTSGGLYVILHHPPQRACAHAHTHTPHISYHTSQLKCHVSFALMCNPVCVSDIRMGWGELMLWKYPTKQSLFFLFQKEIIPYALEITMIVLSSWFVTFKQTRVPKNKVLFE